MEYDISQCNNIHTLTTHQVFSCCLLHYIAADSVAHQHKKYIKCAGPKQNIHQHQKSTRYLFNSVSMKLLSEASQNTHVASLTHIILIVIFSQRIYRTETHTQTNALWPSWILSGTTRVSQYQKSKTRKVKSIWIYWSMK